MTEQQISKLVAAFVEHQSAFSVLSTEDRQWVIQNTKQAIAICAEAIKNRPKLAERFLKLLGTIDIPAITEPFIAKEKFVVDTSHEAEVKISHLGYNFQKIFLNRSEFKCGPSKIRYHKLLKGGLVDDNIINELGGKYLVETNLYEMFYSLRKQGHRQTGALLINGSTNIFYIRDNEYDEGVLWAVVCRWFAGGWCVDANDPIMWSDGPQVFSRIPYKSQS